MEDKHGFWTSLKNEEFQEEDVWGTFDERKDSNSNNIISSLKEPSFISKRHQTATKTIPKSNSKNNNNPIISAPVKIPDWSKIYGTSSFNVVDESDDKEDENVIPPHEWIARRNQMSSFSVCEGAGRTLKGRDLSRVRNAVLTKTGFLES